MASNINESGINELYPVAGIDNDSQGFRDNFSSIKSNFTVAKTEIEDLQNNTARTDNDVSFNGNEISQAVFSYNTEKVFQAGTITSNQNVSLTNGPVQVVGVGANITLTLSEWPEQDYAKIRLLIVNIGSTAKTLNFSIQGGGEIKTRSVNNLLLATEMTIGRKYKIVLPNDSLFTAHGSVDNDIGTTFLYSLNGVGNSITGSGLVTEVGFEATTVPVTDQDNFAIIDFFSIDGGTTVYAEYKGIYS